LTPSGKAGLLVPDTVDLHIHTLRSDGTETPAEVVAAARAVDLAAIAITDHDTVEGVAEAAAAAQGSALRVVPGVEITCQRNGAETHVLGLFIDPANPGLAADLARKRTERLSRVQAMAERLAAMGKPVDVEAVLADLKPASPGRTHLAEALRRAGHVHDIQEAFDTYIEEGGPAYIPQRRFTVPEACALLRAAGGLPILAHPEMLLREDLGRLVGEGIAGLEAYYPTFAPGWSRTLRQWAHELDLGIAGGSDHHGRHRPGAPIGVVRVPFEFFEDLERRLTRARSAS
jgi:predicted metal-dependent phosphoesterase TrpH